jgi:hypothetical protein
MKKKFNYWMIVIPVVLVIILSLTGIMNDILFSGPVLGRTSDLTQGKIPCKVVSDCPKPSCFGSFNVTQKTTVQLSPNATAAEKAAASLDNSWYDMQGKLTEVKCVDLKCQTSPFCIIEYSDVTGWLGNQPFQWIKEYPWVLGGLVIIGALIIFATAGVKKN